MRYLLALLVLSVSATVASADNCDNLVDRMTTAVPGLHFDGRTRTTVGLDAFNLHHADARQVVVFCGPKLLTFNVYFQNGFPPPGYYELVGQMATASMKVSDDKVANIARECARRARMAKDDEAAIEGGGISVHCGSAGGAIHIIVVKKSVASERVATAKAEE